MLRNIKADFTKILILLFVIINVTLADINIIIYPLKNVSGDISIDWFGSAFVEIIMGHYRNIESVKIYDKSKINNLDYTILNNENSYVLRGYYNYFNSGFNVDIEIISVNTWKTEKKNRLYIPSLDYADVVEKTIYYIDSFIDSVSLSDKSTNIKEEYISRNIAHDISEAFTIKNKEVYDRISLEQSYITDLDLSRFERDFFCSLYDIEIEKPIVNVDEYNEDYANITFLIRFKVNIDEACDVIENLKYFEKSVDTESIIYRIPKNKILVKSDKLYKIISGDYNTYPVIYLTTGDGKIVYIIIDVPYNFEMDRGKKRNIVFVNRFRPLVEILDETKSLRIKINKNEIQVSYPFRIKKDILVNLDEIRVEMLNEDKIVELLK